MSRPSWKLNHRRDCHWEYDARRDILPGSVPMRHPIAAAALILAATCPVLPASAQTAATERPADAAAIRAHIESIFQAFVDKDRPKLEATHGAEWRGFTPWSGHVIRGRDGYMNEATFPPGVPKGQGMVGYRIGEFDIVFYGDTAVVSFQAEVDRMQGADKSTQKLTFVDVYHKDPGGWIQVASNTSLHPEAISQIVSQRRMLDPEERAALMQAREAVWRAWFAGDEATLKKLLPPDLITIDSASSTFGTLQSNLDGARGFAASGGKLTRLRSRSTATRRFCTRRTRWN
jgi:hypothetical protein